MKYGFFSRLMSLSYILKASVISFIAIIALGIYDFTLPIFTESQAESFAIVGLVFSLVYVASFLAEIPTGLAVDKYGRIKVLLFAISAIAVLGIVYYFIQNIVLLAVLSLIFGAFSVGFWIPSAVLVRDYSPRNMLSQAEALYLDITQLGKIFGPMIAGLVAAIFLARFNFLLVSIFMFVAVIVGLIIFRKHKHKKTKEKAKGHRHKANISLFAILFKEFISVHKHAAPLYALTFLVYIWMAVEWAFVPLAGIIRFGFTDVGAGIILGAMMAIEGALYYFSGYFMDKIGKRYIITAGFFLLFSSTYFMFLATSPAVFIFAALIAAASVSWILPGTESLLTEIVPTNLYGEMSGVFDTSKDVGLIIGPLASGLIATYLANPLAPFLFVAVTAGAAALISGWVFWPAKTKK
jgi:MFS family permease